MTRQNKERLQEIRRIRTAHNAQSGEGWMYRPELVDELLRIATEEMERARRLSDKLHNLRGELE